MARRRRALPATAVRRRPFQGLPPPAAEVAPDRRDRREVGSPKRGVSVGLWITARRRAGTAGTLLLMDGDELEPRVSALEGEVREIRARLRISEQDAAAARVLAGAADRDVGEIHSELRDFRRATTGSFNAVREDLVDLRTNLVDLRAEMRSKFDLSAAGQQQIVGMLQTLIDREDR